METQAGVSLGNTDGGVDAEDLHEVSRGLTAEVARPGIVGAELGLETVPRDQRRFPEIAHPVGEPDVEIDRQRRAFELMDRSEIHGDCGTGDLLEKVLTQDNLGPPCWTSW